MSRDDVKRILIRHPAEPRGLVDRVSVRSYPADLATGRGSQVVRLRSAKPLFAGSIPAPASINVRSCKSASIDAQRQRHRDLIV